MIIAHGNSNKVPLCLALISLEDLSVALLQTLRAFLFLWLILSKCDNQQGTLSLAPWAIIQNGGVPTLTQSDEHALAMHCVRSLWLILKHGIVHLTYSAYQVFAFET